MLHALSTCDCERYGMLERLKEAQILPQSEKKVWPEKRKLLRKALQRTWLHWFHGEQGRDWKRRKSARSHLRSLFPSLASVMYIVVRALANQLPKLNNWKQETKEEKKQRGKARK